MFGRYKPGSLKVVGAPVLDPASGTYVLISLDLNRKAQLLQKLIQRIKVGEKVLMTSVRVSQRSPAGNIAILLHKP